MFYLDVHKSLAVKFIRKFAVKIKTNLGNQQETNKTEE